MSFTSAKQLKDWIHNRSLKSGVPASTLMQNYLMERFLERVSISPYQRNIILKGGFLIAAMIGGENRSTMDIDTTIKGLPSEHQEIERLLRDIISIDIGDQVVFNIISIKSIHEASAYEDFRVSLDALLFSIRGNLKIDMTTGDRIIPGEIEYPLRLMFEHRSIPLMAYNLNTILAEKMETILRRNISNTRGRDFYDVYMLLSLNGASLSRNELQQALRIKAQERGSHQFFLDYQKHLANISASPEMGKMWQQYVKRYPYAKDISFESVIQKIFAVFGRDGD